MLSLSLVGLAISLASAAPGQNPASGKAAAGLHDLSKRDTYSCGLDMYPKATQGPIGDGIDYMNGKMDTKMCVDADSCSRISCSYGTGFNLCAGADGQFCLTGWEIARSVLSLYNECGYTEFDDGRYISAMQVWKAGGDNILVTGGFDC